MSSVALTADDGEGASPGRHITREAAEKAAANKVAAGRCAVVHKRKVSRSRSASS